MENKTISTDRPIAIYYTFHSNVNWYSSVGNSQCVISITGEWNYIHTSIAKIDIQEKPVLTNAGRKFVTQLSAVCPGHDDDTPGDIDAISGRKAVFKVVYKSGRIKIIGTNDHAPEAILREITNQTTQRILEFTWENTKPNMWLS